MRFRVKKDINKVTWPSTAILREKKLELEMAPFYISSQSKKVQPNMSLDERLNVCVWALYASTAILREKKTWIRNGTILY